MSQKLTIRIVRSAAKAIAEAADWWQVNMLLAIPPGVCGAVPPPLLGRFRAGWQIEALY